jgi:histidinol-phosphate aminotransferase
MNNWEKNLIQIDPYVPGDQPSFPDMIKLNTNENPYPPAPGVEKALKAFDADTLRLYPAVSAEPVLLALSEFYGIETDRIFAGVGSDDVLATAFRALFNSDKPVLFPDITYSFYDVWAKLFGVPFEQIPLDADFRMHKEDYVRENGGVIICNPNAPTSIAEPLEFVEFIVKNNPDSVVVVDEAYVDFGAETALPLLDKYENLLVVQTFSKSRSLAGLRIGYAFGSRRLIRALNDVKNSYNSYTINRLSAAVGPAAIEDREYFERTCERIIRTRENSAKELKKLGFRVNDSSTNFLFATHPEVPAERIFTELKERHIFVRWFNKPRLKDYLRITVGTDEQMEKLLCALYEIINT